MSETYRTYDKYPSLPHEYPVYGSSRIGMANTDAEGTVAHYLYEVSDHLGNVRATVRDDYHLSNEPYTYADYYPFGMVIPGRSKNGSDYRFGYQGQFAEKDDETGYNAFELRLYDSRLGRWMTTDPYGQHWSPYLGMGNNPMMMIDPNGGIDWPWNWSYKAWKGTRASRKINPEM